MNRYLCWVAGRRDETEEEIEAISSFDARKVKAKQWNVDVIYVIATRLG